MKYREKCKRIKFIFLKENKSKQKSKQENEEKAWPANRFYGGFFYALQYKSIM